jgi:hypothetical protein
MVSTLQKFASERASSDGVALVEVVGKMVGSDLEPLAAIPLGFSNSTYEVLCKHVDVQKGIIDICKNLVVEEESLFCQMHKGTIDLSSTIAALEAKVLVSKQHKCAIKVLVS